MVQISGSCLWTSYDVIHSHLGSQVWETHIQNNHSLANWYRTRYGNTLSSTNVFYLGVHLPFPPSSIGWRNVSGKEWKFTLRKQLAVDFKHLRPYLKNDSHKKQFALDVIHNVHIFSNFKHLKPTQAPAISASRGPLISWGLSRCQLGELSLEDSPGHLVMVQWSFRLHQTMLWPSKSRKS